MIWNSKQKGSLIKQSIDKNPDEKMEEL